MLEAVRRVAVGDIDLGDMAPEAPEPDLYRALIESEGHLERLGSELRDALRD